MIILLVIIVLFTLVLYIAYKTRLIYTLVYKVFNLRSKIRVYIFVNIFQVDAQSTAYGGELVADVLKVEK